jgi:flagellar basal-body rod protein FlgF
MENTSLIALSRATALERQMQVVANNVANMNTTGFKAEAPLFIEMVEQPQKDERYSMVMDLATLRDTSNGPINMTGNPLDVALEGNGYFAVDTVDGPRYTRAGNFALNDARELVNSAGLPVLDDVGSVITIPPNVAEIRIGSDGSISTDAGPLAKLGVVRFEREQFMNQLGNGLYQTNEQPLPAEEIRIRQGFLENSNVNSIMEMTSMIEVNRQYQSVQRLLQGEHERLRNAYQKLSRLS